MAQWLIEGLTATISGVLTVFIVLILIAFLISQLKYINGLNLGRKVMSKNPITANSVISEPVKVDVQDNHELIAVLTAAIAVSMNTTTDHLVVRSIRRVEGNRRRL